MLKMLESPDDVLAAEVAGKITGGDLDVIMDRLDAAMARPMYEGRPVSSSPSMLFVSTKT